MAKVEQDQGEQESELGWRLEEWLDGRGMVLVDFEVDVPAPEGCSEGQLKRELRQRLREKGYPEDSWAEVMDAMVFARERYFKAGIVKRQTGDDIMSHPLWMANVAAAKGNVERKVMLGIILHDIPEDTETEIGEIEAGYGKDVAEAVEAVTKEKSRKITAEEMGVETDEIRYFKLVEGEIKRDQDKTVQKIYDLLFEDPVVVLIKLLDSAQNMLTLHGIKDPAKRKEKARIALEYYAPLARMLGLVDLAELIEVGGYVNTLSVTMTREEYFQKDENWMFPEVEEARQLMLESKEWGDKQLRPLLGELLNQGEQVGLVLDRVETGWPNMYQVATRNLGEGNLLPRIKMVVPNPQRKNWVEFLKRNLGARLAQGPSNMGELHPDEIVYGRNYLLLPLLVDGVRRELEVLLSTPEAEVPVEVLFRDNGSESERRHAFEKLQLIRWRYYQEMRRSGRVVERFLGEAGQADRLLVFDKDGRPWYLPQGATGLDLAYLIHSGLGARAVKLQVTKASGKPRSVEVDYVLSGGEQIVIEENVGKEVGPVDFDKARTQKTWRWIQEALNARRQRIDKEVELAEQSGGNMLETEARRKSIGLHDEYRARGYKVLRWAVTLKLGRELSSREWRKMVEDSIDAKRVAYFGSLPKAIPYEIRNSDKLPEELYRSKKIRELLSYVEKVVVTSTKQGYVKE